MGTDVLFVGPSASRGVARVLDFWGDLTMYNVSPTPQLADALALRSDFMVVGKDLEEAKDHVVGSSPDQLEMFDK